MNNERLIKKIKESYSSEYDVVNLQCLEDNIYMFKAVHAKEPTAYDVRYNFVKVEKGISDDSLIFYKNMDIDDLTVISNKLNDLFTNLQKENSKNVDKIIMLDDKINNLTKKRHEKRHELYDLNGKIEKTKNLFSIADDLSEFKEIFYKYILKEENKDEDLPI